MFQTLRITTDGTNNESKIIISLSILEISY